MMLRRKREYLRCSRKSRYVSALFVSIGRAHWVEIEATYSIDPMIPQFTR